MKYDLIIVRYGEIALKSKYVRKKFENILIKNIKNALKEEKIENKIKKEMGRIYIYTDKIDSTKTVLEKIFGIVNFSPALKTDSKISLISKTSIDFLKNYLKKDMSFAVRVSRTGNHNYTSQDIEKKIGSDIVEKYGNKVDLTNPDFKLFIEIRENISYIFNEKIPGPGGMPISSQNNVLCIIDNKFSILASFYLLRRGCNVLFFVKKDFDKKTLKNFLKKWYIKSDIIIFDEKEGFYNQMKNILSTKKCKAIVTGFYNLNTKNLSKIKEYKKRTNLPVFSPLMSLNKEELKEKIKEIGL